MSNRRRTYNLIGGLLMGEVLLYDTIKINDDDRLFNFKREVDYENEIILVFLTLFDDSNPYSGFCYINTTNFILNPIINESTVFIVNDRINNLNISVHKCENLGIYLNTSQDLAEGIDETYSILVMAIPIN